MWLLIKTLKQSDCNSRRTNRTSATSWIFTMKMVTEGDLRQSQTFTGRVHTLQPSKLRTVGSPLTACISCIIPTRLSKLVITHSGEFRSVLLTGLHINSPTWSPTLSRKSCLLSVLFCFFVCVTCNDKPHLRKWDIIYFHPFWMLWMLVMKVFTVISQGLQLVN